MDEQTKPFAEDVWDTLSSIDCSTHVKDKGEFTYLSWVWAWGILMEHYPESEYVVNAPVVYPNETSEMGVVVTVKRGEESLTRFMWLPVMNFKNQAIPNADSRQISDTRMRCLVKCIAMFGLGHHIYAGEDIPREEDAKPIHRFKSGEAEKIVTNVMCALEADSFEMLTRAYGEGYDKLDPVVKIKIHRLFDSPTRSLIKQLQAEGEKDMDKREEEDATEQLDIQMITENRNGS